MPLDRWHIYHQMLRSRLVEQAIVDLWHAGHISGEMHMGLGEEAIVAGTVCQLQDGDALALDHRGTPPLVMRGVALVPLLREMLGCEDGLCGGMGGHMHLFAPDLLAASSGIVGAAAPAAVGFAVAAQHLRPNTIAIGYFGEAALNQGMVMEALNLAVVWEAPVLFVCKDNNWSITTRSDSMTGGDILDRARSFGLPVESVDGGDVMAVWDAAQPMIARARNGGGPGFLHARCTHLEGHFLGDPVLGLTREPIAGIAPLARPLVRAATASGGGSIRERAASLMSVTGLVGRMFRDHRLRGNDPVARLRKTLLADKNRVEQIERNAAQEVADAVQAAVADLRDVGEGA